MYNKLIIRQGKKVKTKFVFLCPQEICFRCLFVVIFNPCFIVHYTYSFYLNSYRQQIKDIVRISFSKRKNIVCSLYRMNIFFYLIS